MSPRPPLLVTKPAVILVLLGILVLHVLSIWLLWYTRIWWIDIVLHVLGGAWIALLFFYVKNIYAPRMSEVAPVPLYFMVVVGMVMFVGVAWEWFEYAFDFFFFYSERFLFRAQLGLTDTMGDLAADFIGGAVAALYIIVRERARRIHA